MAKILFIVIAILLAIPLLVFVLNGFIDAVKELYKERKAKAARSADIDIKITPYELSEWAVETVDWIAQKMELLQRTTWTEEERRIFLRPTFVDGMRKYQYKLFHDGKMCDAKVLITKLIKDGFFKSGSSLYDVTYVGFTDDFDPETDHSYFDFIKKVAAYKKECEKEKFLKAIS